MKPHEARVLLVGLGGLGCPAALALARAGIGSLGLCDDDLVDRTNLHRQILFRDDDVGKAKLPTAEQALRRVNRDLPVELHSTRLLPDNAAALVSRYDVVLEGTDNFATKFLTSDACALAGVPVVHASAVRWMGTVLAVGPRGRPCYRCVFEDVPDDETTSCAEAGVMGPILGVIAAAQVDLGLALIEGAPVSGELVTFDGRAERFRRRHISARADCRLCGPLPAIRRIDAAAYVAPVCTG